MYKNQFWRILTSVLVVIGMTTAPTLASATGSGSKVTPDTGSTGDRIRATYAVSGNKTVLALVTVNTYYSWASDHFKAVGDCQAVGKVDLTYLRAYNTTGSCMVDDPWQSYTTETPNSTDGSYIRTAQGLSG